MFYWKVFISLLYQINKHTKTHTIMKTLVETVILSHLSDASIEMNYNPELAKKRLQFVRLLVATYPNTETQVTMEILDEIWLCVNK